MEKEKESWGKTERKNNEMWQAFLRIELNAAKPGDKKCKGNAHIEAL
jgi:hypothetical protein